MSCPHAESTAILSLFDEAPPDYAAHLHSCADCQATIASHRETIDLISPHIAPARPHRRQWPQAIFALAALAACVLLSVRFILPPPPPLTETIEQVSFERDQDEDRLDDALLSLELELALMNLEEN
ncbi:MAG: hypothetical protein ACI8S6_001219 [Myxococcota bacterium]|jgi:hypothetical protein